MNNMTVTETPVMAQGVVHIVEPHLQIVYGSTEIGNVDTRLEFGDGELALANRQEFLRVLNPTHYVLQKVLMESDFLDLSDISDDCLAHVYETDGLFIDRPGIAVGLNTADCNAITMYDARHGSVLGLIHVGRQGLEGDIHLAGLENLTSRHGVAKEDIRMHFAPMIRKESYYYPSLPAEQLADPKWKGFIELRRGNHHIDLLGRVVKELVAAGIEPEQMQISPIDVGTDRRYFSHVRSKRESTPHGRNGVAAMLVKAAIL